MSMNVGGDDQGMMAEINVTPLVDVMLVLLVIFIVTAPLIVPQAMKVSLPQTVPVAQQDQAKNKVLVISPQGSLSYDNRSVEDKSFVLALTADKADPNFQLQIQADRTVPYGRVAEVMALAQSAGVTRLSFVTLPKPGR